MTQSAYANSIINNMLGWLKGFAGWVLRLFNLAGSGGSPLAWLADHWLQLLIVLLATGIVIDLLVWLFRWRPYWVWFGKKRILIEDENFFVGEDTVDSGLYDRKLFGREVDDEDEPPRRRRRSDEDAPEEFVVASTVVRRSGGTRTRDARLSRDIDRDEVPEEHRHHLPAAVRKSAGKRADGEKPAARTRSDDDPFDLEANDPNASSFWEDDVFNVSDLPVSEQPEDFEPKADARKKQEFRKFY